MNKLLFSFGILLCIIPSLAAMNDPAVLDTSKLFFMAAQNGDKSTIDLLLSQGADVNSADDEGRTPLHFASMNGHADVVELLLRNKAHVMARSAHGHTPLHSAALFNQVKVIEFLLKNKAKVNTVITKSNCTALFAAAQMGHEDSVQVLLKYKADQTIRNSEDVAPLHIASQEGYENIVKLLLLHGADVNVQGGPRKQTPLHLAVCDGREEVVKMLLEHKADVDIEDGVGGTPLHLASQNGCKTIVKLLLLHGADVNKKNNGGASPLYLAACHGREEVVKILLEHKAKVDIRNKQEVTPLHIASQDGYKTIVKLLLSYGADVNAKDFMNQTALYLAACVGREDVVQLLVDNGAEVNVVSKMLGAAPLYMAAQNGHLETVKVLVKNGAKVNIDTVDQQAPLLAAARSGHCVIVEFLLQNGAEVNKSTNCKVTSLHVAAQSGQADAASLLISHGADLYAKDLVNKTPLYQAAESGHKDVCELLLKGIIYTHCLEKAEESYDRIMTSFLCFQRCFREDFLQFLPSEMMSKIYINLSEDVICGALYKSKFEVCFQDLSRRTLPLLGKKNMIAALYGLISEKLLKYCSIRSLENMTASEIAHSNNHKEIEDLLDTNTLLDRWQDLINQWLKVASKKCFDENLLAEFKNLKKCAYCNKEGQVKRCSACKKVVYCSRACQTQNRPSHKTFCQAEVQKMRKQTQKLKHAAQNSNPSKVEESFGDLWAQASHEGNISTLGALLDKGFDINYVQTPGGPTALHVTASNGDIEAVRFLLSQGADHSLMLFLHSLTAEDMARINRHHEVELLLASYEVESDSEEKGESVQKTRSTASVSRERTEQTNTKKCEACSKTENLKCCGRCKKVYFCDVVCQRHAWATHKKNCFG